MRRFLLGQVLKSSFSTLDHWLLLANSPFVLQIWLSLFDRAFWKTFKFWDNDARSKYVRKMISDHNSALQVRMKALLVSKVLWPLVDPAVNENASTDHTKSEQALALTTRPWESHEVHVEEFKTEQDGWKKLQSIYAEPGNTNLARLYEKIFMLHIRNSEEPRRYLRNWQKRSPRFTAWEWTSTMYFTNWPYLAVFRQD